MVFMNADSGGDPHEWVLMDDLELIDATGSAPDVHIVLEVSRSGVDPYDGAWKGTRRYYVAGPGTDPGRLEAVRLADPPGVDPASGDALRQFASWAEARYPATHRMLVVEAHGSGWRGLSPCDIQADPGCLITIPDGELGSALAGSAPLDLVVLNACLMGMWETGFALREATRYAVTSEEIGGPLLGSWHDLVPRLAAGPDGAREVCASIPPTLPGERTRANSATRSCIDLEQHGPLTAAVDDLARSSLEDGACVAALGRAVRASLAFGKPDHHDLGDLARLLASDPDASPSQREASRGVLDALGSYVVAHESSPFVGVGGSHGVCGPAGEWTGCDRSTGVAIWAPLGDSGHLLTHYLEGPWCATRWDEALAALSR
jgi:hypothetical protein